MSAREKGSSIEGYREVPSELLERRPYAGPPLRARLAPYGFGVGVLAALGAALFFLVISPVGGVEEDVPVEGEVERLVASAKERMNPTGAAQVPSEGESVVFVSTVPVGALVDIDFQHIGAAPLEYATSPGVYLVSIRMPDYVGIDTVVIVEAGDVKELSFGLTPEGWGTERAVIDDDPPADVEVAAAANPSGNAERRAGNSRSTAAQPELDAQTSTPAATAELVISSHPTGAEAYLDGRRIGETPVSIRSVATGDHQVRLLMEGYESYEMDVHAGADETTSLHAELTRRIGTLEVLVRPWGSIYIDGVLHKQTTDIKYVTQLPVGEYLVTAVHPNLGSAERTVRIDASATQEVVIHLTDE